MKTGASDLDIKLPLNSTDIDKYLKTYFSTKKKKKEKKTPMRNFSDDSFGKLFSRSKRKHLQIKSNEYRYLI